MGTSGSSGSTGVNDSPLNNPPTNLKKESVNCKLTVNQPIQTESYIQTTFAIKIPLSIYKKYNYELTGIQKKIVREALKQFMSNLVLNIDNISNVNNVSVNNNNVNFNVNININNIQQSQEKEKEEADVFTAERIKQLKQKLKEAQEVLKEYKVKAQKYDKIQHYVKLYRQGTIDVKTLINTILQEG